MTPDQQPKPKKKRAPRVKRISIALPKVEWMKIYMALRHEAVNITRKVDELTNPRIASNELERSKKHFRLAAFIDRVVSTQEMLPDDDDCPF